MKHPVRFALRLALLLLLVAWLLPVSWVFWPPLELNQTFAKRIAPLRNAFYRAEDPFRRVFGGFSIPDTLPVLRFTLPDTAEARLMARLDTIRARGVNVAASRAWVGAKLRFNDAEDGSAMPAEITWHGKFQNHWLGRQRSLKVKLAKGEQWWGLRSFTLITPDNRDLIGLPIAYHLADQLGVWHPRVRLVRVELNGADLGLYYAEEPIDRDFLQRRGLPNGVLLAPRAAWADDFPDHRRTTPYGQHVGLGRGAHVNELALEPAFQEVDAPNDSLAAEALGALADLRDAALLAGPLYDRAPDPATAPLPPSSGVTILCKMDQERWAAADALRHLLADQHNMAGDNLHLVYDPMHQTFFPLYRFEGGLAPLERANGLTNAATLTYNGHPLPLWQLVNRQPELRYLKLHVLYKLTATPKAIEAALRAAAPVADLVLRAGGSEFPIRQRRWKADKMLGALRQNQRVIHQSLAEASLYVNVINEGDSAYLMLELLPETEGEVEVEVLEKKGWEKRWLRNRTGPLYPGGPEALLRTVATMRVERSAVLQIRAFNGLTRKPLTKQQLHVARADRYRKCAILF